MLAESLLTAACAVVLLGVAGLRRVPEGTACTVHRFGRYVRTLPPGLRLMLPGFDRIAQRVPLVGHQVDLQIGGEPAARAEVFFQILEPGRTGAALERVDAMVADAARERLDTLAPQAEAAQLAGRLKQDLNDHLGAFGLRVTRCQLRRAA